ncbi:craniofacial development protein 2-like [Plakobranchus ocellatus]|uniref:Craniofacial development protein 2-like n=1 Tax=Plakobranchus ocellatus TaxID=259542 RepID=A0AAV3ZCU1_9GAST|nr:craniofacial development protein 2-like [Plakobranchus ocellatus]
MSFKHVHKKRISQGPAKTLGRWYNSSLKDIKCGSEALEQVSVGLQAIDKCGLPGKYSVVSPVYAYPKALVATSSIMRSAPQL